MAERRCAGGKLLKAGQLTHAEIARELGVSRVAVGQWAARVADDGLRALKSRTSSGRPPKLDRTQKHELVRCLKRGACRAGFDSDCWTLPRVQALIQQTLGVSYHPNYVGRVLAGVGWSRQKPQARAIERDDELVRAWLAHDWPRIKKGAAQRRHYRVL